MGPTPQRGQLTQPPSVLCMTMSSSAEVRTLWTSQQLAPRSENSSPDSFTRFLKRSLEELKVTSVPSTLSSFILTVKAMLVAERTDMFEYTSLTRLTLTSNSISKQGTRHRQVIVNVITTTEFLHRQ